MSEDFTSLAVAYLLGQLDPSARADFEARLDADRTAAGELKEIADALAAYATTDTPPLPLSSKLKHEMQRQILSGRSNAKVSAAWRRMKFMWPLAAAILLTLNAGQWWYYRASLKRIAERTALAASADKNTFPPRDPEGTDLPGTPAALTSQDGKGAAPRPATGGAAPTIRRTMTFLIAQSTTVTTPVPQPNREYSQPHGALELHNLPLVGDERSLYLWARRAGKNQYEPVGEIPRQIYGGSGTVNYQLRPGDGVPVHFVISIEARGGAPVAPSHDVVCGGP